MQKSAKAIMKQAKSGIEEKAGMGQHSQLQTRSKYQASRRIPTNGRGKIIPQGSIFFPDIVVNSYHIILGKIQDILEKIQDLKSSSWPAS